MPLPARYCRHLSRGGCPKKAPAHKSRGLVYSGAGRSPVCWQRGGGRGQAGVGAAAARRARHGPLDAAHHRLTLSLALRTLVRRARQPGEGITNL